MGFSEAELDASSIAMSRRCWPCQCRGVPCREREVLDLLSQAQDVENRDRRSCCARGQHGDGSHFYGLTIREVALRVRCWDCKRKERHYYSGRRTWVTEGSDQQQERSISKTKPPSRCRHGLGRRHVAALIGGQASIRAGSIRGWVDHGRGRHRTSWPSLLNLFDAALKIVRPNLADAPSTTPRCPRPGVWRCLPVQRQSARGRTAAPFPRPIA